MKVWKIRSVWAGRGAAAAGLLLGGVLGVGAVGCDGGAAGAEREAEHGGGHEGHGHGEDAHAEHRHERGGDEHGGSAGRVEDKAGGGKGEHDHAGHDDHDHAHADEGGVMRVSESVERNLGLTWASVERRAVGETLRVPGAFELLPSARRDYHAAVSGRVELLVSQYESVEAGALLAMLDSPQWRELQAGWAEAVSMVEVSASGTAVAEAMLAEQRRRVGLLGERVDRLDAAAVRRVELDQELAEAELALPRLEAELDAARVGERQAGAKVSALRRQAASLTGLSVEQLTSGAGEVSEVLRPAMAGPGGGGEAMLWERLERVPMRAVQGGVVASLAVTSGQWVQPGDEVLQTIVADGLRFRAEALLGDAVGLRDGMSAAVVPPRGLVAAEAGAAVTGRLRLGPTAHAADRTVSLYVELADGESASGGGDRWWARAGGPGFLEVVRGGGEGGLAGGEGGGGVLAIPRSALVQDGLSFVFFKREAAGSERVRRVVAETGRSDGRWVELLNQGVSEGDRIVVDGVYQLLAASSATMQRGGHFHSDGTFHEGEDE